MQETLHRWPLDLPPLLCGFPQRREATPGDPSARGKPDRGLHDEQITAKTDIQTSLLALEAWRLVRP
jgi:hypothetical protein